MRHLIISLIMGALSVTIVTTFTVINTVNSQNKHTIKELQRDLNLTTSYSKSLEEALIVLEDETKLREDITSLIVDAGRSYNIHPMVLTKLIKSESNFRPNPNHSSPNWVGSGGINVKANPRTRNNPNSYVGGIYATAERLDREIEKHGSLYNALIGYKGFNLQGREYADKVYMDYVNYLKEK